MNVLLLMKETQMLREFKLHEKVTWDPSNVRVLSFEDFTEGAEYQVIGLDNTNPILQSIFEKDDKGNNVWSISERFKSTDGN